MYAALGLRYPCITQAHIRRILNSITFRKITVIQDNGTITSCKAMEQEILDKFENKLAIGQCKIRGRGGYLHYASQILAKKYFLPRFGT